jgi:hypothetical protein
VEACVEARLVGDVHPAVLGPDHVEAAVVEGEHKGVADLVGHLGAEAEPGGE